MTLTTIKVFERGAVRLKDFWSVLLFLARPLQ